MNVFELLPYEIFEVICQDMDWPELFAMRQTCNILRAYVRRLPVADEIMPVPMDRAFPTFRPLWEKRLDLWTISNRFMFALEPCHYTPDKNINPYEKALQYPIVPIHELYYSKQCAGMEFLMLRNQGATYVNKMSIYEVAPQVFHPIFFSAFLSVLTLLLHRECLATEH